MTAEQIVEALKGAVADLQPEVVPAIDQPTLLVPREQITAVLRALRDHPGLRFDLLADLTAVDWWPGEPRFQVVYLLASLGNRLRLRVKTSVPGEDARIATATAIWPAAGWLEREVFDLFGIVFEGHPDLRRVLMPEDWEGYPLRKDYPVQIKMPVKIYEPLELTEEQFQKNIENDRYARSRKTNQPAGEAVNAAQGDTRKQTRLTRE